MEIVLVVLLFVAFLIYKTYSEDKYFEELNKIFIVRELADVIAISYAQVEWKESGLDDKLAGAQLFLSEACNNYGIKLTDSQIEMFIRSAFYDIGGLDEQKVDSGSDKETWSV
jgi:hypothetical protein